MKDQTQKMPRQNITSNVADDYVPTYLGDSYKRPEAFIRKAEEMKIFLALNPIPEEFLPTRTKA